MCVISICRISIGFELYHISLEKLFNGLICLISKREIVRFGVIWRFWFSSLLCRWKESERREERVRVFMADSALVIRSSVKQRQTKTWYQSIIVHWMPTDDERFLCSVLSPSHLDCGSQSKWEVHRGVRIYENNSSWIFFFARQNENRKGRIFFISTSIVSTTSQCYVTDTTLTACAAKKKRNLILEADDSDGLNTDSINPMAPERFSWTIQNQNERNLIFRREDELDSGLEDAEDGSLRDGRFLLYWHTTTSTSYTSTSTLASLACTPSGFTLSLCG